MISALGGDFNHHFNLNARIQGKCVGSDGGPRVAPSLSKNLLKEVACTIGDLGLVGESIVARHKDSHANDSHDMVKRS